MSLVSRNRQPAITEEKVKLSTRFFEILRMIGRLRSDLPLLVRLVKAWKEGLYPGLSIRTLASLAVAVLYVVSPVDFVPDFIPGIGFLDDAAVVALVLHSMAQDLAAFRTWEESRNR